MIEHTPGPWCIAKGDGGQILAPSSSGQPDRYEQVIYFDGYNYFYKSPGDARLIAAAPEMLAVLDAARIILKNRDQRPNEAKLLDAIKIVIAKATGEQSPT